MVNPLTGQPGFSLQDEALAWAAKLHAHVDLSQADLKAIAWILETLVKARPSDAARDLAEYVRDTDFKYGANRKGAKSLAVKCLAVLAAPVPNKPMPLKFTNEWLKKGIESDGDDEPSAGDSPCTR